jgi:transcriptional regulator with XRE-family HTH domain
LGLSQSALADALLSTQRHISFLETGRSQPTPSFLSRLCTDLKLSAGQRANLFAASGLRNPYEARHLDSPDIISTLDLMAEHLLKNWPFPAFVLDREWNVLRQNSAAANMLAALHPSAPHQNPPENLLQVLLSDPFMALITNWEEVSPSIYFRLQSSATRDENVAQIFEDARARGLFDHIQDVIVRQKTAPVFVPLTLDLGLDAPLKLTSLLGNLAANQDALVEEFEIELMMPVDAASDAILRSFSS